MFSLTQSLLIDIQACEPQSVEMNDRPSVSAASTDMGIFKL